MGCVLICRKPRRVRCPPYRPALNWVVRTVNSVVCQQVPKSQIHCGTTDHKVFQSRNCSLGNGAHIKISLCICISLGKHPTVTFQPVAAPLAGLIQDQVSGNGTPCKLAPRGYVWYLRTTPRSGDWMPPIQSGELDTSDPIWRDGSRAIQKKPISGERLKKLSTSGQ